MPVNNESSVKQTSLYSQAVNLVESIDDAREKLDPINDDALRFLLDTIKNIIKDAIGDYEKSPRWKKLSMLKEKSEHCQTKINCLKQKLSEIVTIKTGLNNAVDESNVNTTENKTIDIENVRNKIAELDEKIQEADQAQTNITFHFNKTIGEATDAINAAIEYAENSKESLPSDLSCFNIPPIKIMQIQQNIGELYQSYVDAKSNLASSPSNNEIQASSSSNLGGRIYSSTINFASSISSSIYDTGTRIFTRSPSPDNASSTESPSSVSSSSSASSLEHNSNIPAKPPIVQNIENFLGCYLEVNSNNEDKLALEDAEIKDSCVEKIRYLMNLNSQIDGYKKSFDADKEDLLVPAKKQLAELNSMLAENHFFKKNAMGLLISTLVVGVVASVLLAPVTLGLSVVFSVSCLALGLGMGALGNMVMKKSTSSSIINNLSHEKVEIDAEHESESQPQIQDNNPLESGQPDLEGFVLIHQDKSKPAIESSSQATYCAWARSCVVWGASKVVNRFNFWPSVVAERTSVNPQDMQEQPTDSNRCGR